MPEIGILDDDPDPALIEQRLELLVEKRCRPDGGLDFSAFHGNLEFIRALITRDNFPFGA